MHNSVPTRIRGVTYPSMRAAARAIGVTAASVAQAMDLGTLETCGLGLRGRNPKIHQRKPCWYRGKLYPSLTAAALDQGVTPAAVGHSVKKRGAWA